MSWDASLVVKGSGGSDREDYDFWQYVGEWNYTHNTNAMIGNALEAIGEDPGEHHWLIGHMGPSWFHMLDGMSGKDGARLLSAIVAELDAKPEEYMKMNPSNGWGDYGSLVGVLREMQSRGGNYPDAEWEVSG